MKLSDITPKTSLIKDFVNRLARSTKQAIPIVDVEKTKRIAGASAKPVRMVLENGQSVTLYLRVVTGKDDNNKDIERLDVFRIDINGKNTPISGDFDNSYKPSFNASVDALARTITSGQKAFTAKQAKIKVKSPASNRKPPQNKAQQRNALLDEAKELDLVIEKREKEKSELTEQLNQILDKAA